MPVMKIWSGAKTSLVGTIFGCQKLSTQTRNVSVIGLSLPKVVLRGYMSP